ncbi:trimeric intracellular cation channel family protein [Methylocapsa sp. S129]|uniref:trimeric intracellular cation channel family protein n=1 Tax=Methylocapsa sp. S129 TaxID=1641869 RepID=UPI00131B0572|nr:TRIC cation channel family protein [Methylocapsa sp. S129]
MATTDTSFFRAIDLAGTFVLSIQGASIAAVSGLDALGVLVISLATAMGGGVIRDILVGEHPPEALRGWPLVTVALLGGILTFFAYHAVEQIPESLLVVVDAVGLSLLAVSGAEKALEYKLTPIAAVMMGAISGAGGFTIRDILLAQIPAVLRVDFLATAAIAGAAVLVIARQMQIGPKMAALLGGAVCCILRVVAVWQHWHLPTANLH